MWSLPRAVSTRTGDESLSRPRLAHCPADGLAGLRVRPMVVNTGACVGDQIDLAVVA